MDQVSFKVNGRSYSVGSEVSSSLRLLDYLRIYLELRGTKYMCRQAGCGACIVAVKRPNSNILAVNSCIVPITSCEGWEITTIEEIGNRKKGYNIIQKTLADYNGSQCGYCSPGWVMALYSLLKTKKLSKLEIERSFASNVCRCTGYRSILDAFKTFAIDASDRNILDIEDLEICNKSGKACTKTCIDDDWCVITKDDVKGNDVIKINLKDGKVWYQVYKISDIFSVLQKEGFDSYKLICGNTSVGVYPDDDKIDNPKIFLNISQVEGLKGYTLDQNLVVGAETTLSELLEIFKTISKKDYFNYLKLLYDHIILVAHIAVRNIGSIAGNLMIKHKHPGFQSDLFLLFETVGAQLTLVNSAGVRRSVTMHEFIKTNMKGLVIMNVLLPPLNDAYKLITYKVTPRSQNAHAIVHSGFLFKLSVNYIVQDARIVYGGLSPQFIRANFTERFLKGKKLFTNETLQSALQMLSSEMVVVENPPEPSVTYRKQLALGLFYKGLLSLYPSNSQSRNKSGIIKLHDSRPISVGSQSFDTYPATWPVNQPIPKLEGLIQCAGEAKYTEDLPAFSNEIFAEFVLAKVPKGRITKIDAAEALSQQGVIAFYSAKDIPGLNSFTPADDPDNRIDEEVFCTNEVKYYDQPIGVIVAETRDIAERVSSLVKITCTDVKAPTIKIRDAIKDPTRNVLLREIKPTAKGTEVDNVIRGSNTIHGQYFFTLETLTCVTAPTEEGLAVYATSQHLAAMQVMISRALKLEANRIDVHVRRVGGAYGFKITRIIHTAVACSLVVQKLNRPCRMIHGIATNTRVWGKRFPCATNFEVGVNRKGVIQYANYNLYEDNGYTINENLSQLGVDSFSNAYKSSNWHYKCFDTMTDTAKNTWFRSPGTFENIAMAELLMEQIAYQTAQDPTDVRLANLDPNYPDLKEMFEDLKKTADYTTRRAAVNTFNAANRWKKRGLRFVFLKWNINSPRYFDINISIYQSDGTVAISHGGVEIGQGINTKACQVAAYILNIPLNKIKIKENNTIICPNSAVTGGSQTTQSIIIAVEKCCYSILERIEPVRKQMKNATWEDVINKCYELRIDLQFHSFLGPDDLQAYLVYGVTLAEVEIDVITGEHEILRVDIMEDCGRSINPELDIGQVEGAFVMGRGYWTSEELVYDLNTGELLTDRTWNYYVPQALDIPQDFRVHLRKKSYTKDIIFGSKVCSEPPICMSVVIPIAIREAIVAARREAGLPPTEWFNIDGPYTNEAICLSCATKLSDFKFT